MKSEIPPPLPPQQPKKEECSPLERILQIIAVLVGLAAYAFMIWGWPVIVFFYQVIFGSYYRG